ncbi:blue-light-activated protein [bacterium BMS3Abin01]|nr:blue-light-activated protein [bacterium BMS3Abin01]
MDSHKQRSEDSVRAVSGKESDEQAARLMAAAVDNAMDGVIVSRLNGDIISVNRSGARMLGADAASLTGRNMEEFWSKLNPDHLREEVYRATLRGGWEGELTYCNSDGSDFPAYVSSAAVRGSDGRLTAMVGIFHDISEEKRMTTEILRRNRELAVLNAVTTTSTKSLDLESILADCIDTVVKTMNYDAGMIYMKEAQGGGVVCRAHVGVPEEAAARSGTLGADYAEQVICRRQARFMEDADLWFAETGAVTETPWFASTASIPIVSKDRCVGVVAVFTCETHGFDELERSLLEAVARSIGVAIDNARLFDDVARGKAEWEATFDAMTNGVSIHDRDYTILRANRNLAKMFGTTTAELVGRKCYEVFHDGNAPIKGCPQRRACLSRKNATVTLFESSLDVMLNISVDPIFDRDGNVIGTVHDVRDITEQEQLREQLSRSERLRALGELAGGVAHDFNNYLTVILGNTQLLLADSNDNSDDDRRESLRTIERAATDAAETVRRIQEFTRVRTARSFTMVDINGVIADAMDVSRPRWKDEALARGVEIEMLNSPGDVPLVNANSSELGEVFMNLIINAADALEQGGAIEIESRARGHWVEVTVADNGEGMEEEVMRRIFDPFYTTKGAAGVGLGLSVTYGIINRHGGEISVESSPGKGTTFCVRLPMATVADLEKASVEEPHVDTEMRARVLIIDDIEMIRTLLQGVLEGMGHTVEAAGSGSSGIEIFDRQLAVGEPFDLVMTDLGMPEMSGWEVVEEIKRLSPRTPVAMITGWGDQLDRDRMTASQVDHVIAKPFSVEEVRRLVAKTLTGPALT